jgi:hypothetical protein
MCTEHRWNEHRKKILTVPLCPPQTPHGLAWDKLASNHLSHGMALFWCWYRVEIDRNTDVLEEYLPLSSGSNLRRQHITAKSRQNSPLPRGTSTPKRDKHNDGITTKTKKISS